MEYRGYDSAGIAVVDRSAGEARLAGAKKAGKLANLEKELDARPLPASTTGLGHTRWATHGGPTDGNAHPHFSAPAEGVYTDTTGKVAVIHNGIIENFARLKAELAADGVEFLSETDTEVVAHLLARDFAAAGDGDLGAAMRRVVNRLQGAFTLVAVHAEAPDVVVGARRNSPLVIGVGEGEAFLASDVSAFIAHTREAIEMGQDQVAEVFRDGSVKLTTFDGVPVEGKRFHVSWDASAAEKGGYDWFMQKEIAEQPQAVADTLLGRVNGDGRLVLDEMRLSEEELRAITKIIVVACGTAYHAGLIAKYAIEHWTRIPVEVELASEFRYRDPILTRDTLVIAISQSGETMDTLMAIRHAREQHSRVLAICNTNGSTIPRESDAVVYTHGGPEIGVASTKAFLTQLTACYIVGLYLAQVRGVKFNDEVAEVLTQLSESPAAIAETLKRMDPVRKLARSMVGARTVLFLGRHVGYPMALEGALKLKELAYIHAEGFAAGELKHGPIALIEQDLPVVVVVPSPKRPLLHDKIVSNIQEIRARGAKTIVIAEDGDEAVAPYADFLFHVPELPILLQPLVATVPLQVFAAELADALGYDVDQPRNLAKSVTVE
ncbi:glutamine--fructose-6-phosphate transaminase (isomerizing) [Catenulispora subtropica]|uniref:Glutamine--fructose-6-phosphate aminotransferase [isomerizing] n=2 Tax=Catenulispora subtropica TaxID=450798 RepID=A0ABP5CGB6_9ACTN